MIQTVDGASTFETTIENLMSSTTYLVEVAAVNSDGTGVYSDPPISQLTRGQCELLHRRCRKECGMLGIGQMKASLHMQCRHMTCKSKV